MPGIRPVGRRRRLGRYRVALLLPSRAALVSFMQHVNRLGIPFGAADHIVSEALYFTDPDGLGMEVHAFCKTVILNLTTAASPSQEPAYPPQYAYCSYRIPSLYPGVEW
jgi:hypothetical protein